MVNQDDDQKKSAAAAGATLPLPSPVQKKDEHSTAKSLRTGDPFIRDMENVASRSELDGNARVQSPQASGDTEDSPDEDI